MRGGKKDIYVYGMFACNGGSCGHVPPSAARAQYEVAGEVSG